MTGDPDDGYERIVTMLDDAGVGTIQPGDSIADIVEDAEETGSDEDEQSLGNGPPKPRKFGFSTRRLNEEFSLVLMGSKAVIFLDQPDAMLEDQQRVLTLEAFNAWFANRFTEVLGGDGKIKIISWAKAWLTNRRRRQYRGVEFHPDPDDSDGTPGYLNLWRGFAVKPKTGGSYKIFRDHMLTNVCRGDAAIFSWLFGFFAHMVQRPRERLGVAIVMRGSMGSGKTKVGEIFGSLITRHYFLVDDPRYVTGQFNAHMATCLLLQADEAVWAGDKAAEGRLKGLVTSPIQQIEAKGIDPIRLKNYVRLIMTSNEEWVVPAGKDERRFCVLDVDPRCAQNHDYFREMDEELDDGGREALLADLLAFDLSTINLRQIPRTNALLEQKIHSLNSLDSWWFGRLMDGTTTRGGDKWVQLIPKRLLYDDYIVASDRIGIKRKTAETEVGMKLAKLVPGLRTTRSFWDDGPTMTKREWCFELPSLEQCRAAFEEAMQQPIAWSDMSALREPEALE